MCFETTKSARAKIAKKDIECWKVIQTNGAPIFSYNRRLRYRKNKRKSLVTLIVINGFIDKGYHSYKEECTAERKFNIFVPRNSQVVKRFLIPAGTRYYENETEYVSETIMLVE